MALDAPASHQSRAQALQGTPRCSAGMHARCTQLAHPAPLSTHWLSQSKLRSSAGGIRGGALSVRPASEGQER